MTHVFAFANQKGGVGKTTTVVNLAACLAAENQRVLVVDCDPQANATSHLGINPNHLIYCLYDVIIDQLPAQKAITPTYHVGVDLLPATPALAGAEVELVATLAREHVLRRALLALGEQVYDFVLLDCPPSLGLLTINALTAANSGVIVPVQCEYFALEGLARLLSTIDLVRTSLNPTLHVRGLVMTMYDGRTNLSQQVVNEIRQHAPVPVYQTIIPRNIRLSEAPSYGETILSFAPRSPGAVAYMALAREVVTRMEKA